MAQTAPAFSWIRKMDPQLVRIDSVPLSGGSSPFPWDTLVEKIKSTFALSSAEIHLRSIEWQPAESLFACLPSELIPVHISLSSLEGTACWVMPQEEALLLESLLLTHEKKPLELINTEWEKGLYPFLMLEMCHILDETGFFQGVTPLLQTEDSLPHEASLCLDIDILIEGTSLQGRLIVSPALQKAWAQYRLEKEGPLWSPEEAGNIDVDVHLEAGRTAVTLPLWKEIQEGDFLPLDTCSLRQDFSEGRVTLTVNNKPLFRGKLKDGNLKILEYPIFQEENTMAENEEDEQFEEETSYEEEETEEEEYEDEEEDEKGEEEEEEDEKEEEEEEIEEEEGEAEESQKGEEEEFPTEGKEVEEEAPLHPTPISREKLAGPDEIPLTLVVEAGRLKMSVAQLMQLEPGNLLELDVHPENGVDMTINGKCVARGELVQLGDVLGIRILEKG